MHNKFVHPASPCTTRGRDHPGSSNTHRPHNTFPPAYSIKKGDSVKHTMCLLGSSGWVSCRSSRFRPCRSYRPWRLWAAGIAKHGQMHGVSLLHQLGDPGHCRKETQSRCSCFDAWLQRPDPFINGQISAVLLKVSSSRKLPGFLCDLHPSCDFSVIFIIVCCGIASRSSQGLK